MSRVRSPAYPALSLPSAIESIRKVYFAQQGTPEPRDVVVKHMGYSKPSGTSDKSISALIKYGFLEKESHGNLRVTDRAISILYPDTDNPSISSAALYEAAREPDLFNTIFNRWDHRPSESSLQAFLIREGFNMNSVDNVARSFYDTYDLVNHIERAYDSSTDDDELSDEDDDMNSSNDKIRVFTKAVIPPPSPTTHANVSDILNITKPMFDFETIQINTKIDNQDDLEELIARLESVKGMLPRKTDH